MREREQFLDPLFVLLYVYIYIYDTVYMPVG